ncbi:hypothetical protein F5050DRAFT_839555 [Lentinula boryana]|uniref:Uncharacterized protein n=1 Tax=Lentinula boryana TaxID=40481 RepID=A0ABQ8QMD4_9AGAR|nr:hypothetical protein F5050DRAFT_839555 [Lentinula boryana]
MILSLRSLCAAFLLWTSCSGIAMPVGDTSYQDNTVTRAVSLVRELDGELIDPSTPVKLNPSYSVFESNGSPSVLSPEEWIIDIGKSSWQAQSNTDGILKAVRFDRDRSPLRKLYLGNAVFSSKDHARRILGPLVMIRPGGKFEYTQQIIKALKDGKVWKERDGYKKFESMYKEVEVPIG